MNNTIVSSRFACVNKTSTESTVNVNFPSFVEPILTGMVPDVNAILDSLNKMVPVFS